MKLISINTWGGRLFEPLIKFIKSQAKTTDIFCFQELYFNPLPHHTVFGIRPDLALQIKEAFPDFSMSERLGGTHQDILAYLARRGYDVAERADAMLHDKDIHIGEAIFVKKTLEIIDEGGCQTYVSDDESSAEDIMPSTGNFQYVVV